MPYYHDLETFTRENFCLNVDTKFRCGEVIENPKRFCDEEKVIRKIGSCDNKATGKIVHKRSGIGIMYCSNRRCYDEKIEELVEIIKEWIRNEYGTKYESSQ